MLEYHKPLPYIHEQTQTFWEGTKKHELRIPKCEECNRFFFYPRSICPYCFSDEIKWVKVSGRGKIYSFTISHRAPSPAFKGDIPFNIAIIELDEGIRMLSNIIECSNDDLAINMPVEVVFDDVTAEITLPKFRLRLTE